MYMYVHMYSTNFMPGIVQLHNYAIKRITSQLDLFMYYIVFNYVYNFFILIFVVHIVYVYIFINIYIRMYL